METERRFWSKVGKRNPGECWEWTGGLHSFGYGQFWIATLGRNAGAHIVSLQIHRHEEVTGIVPTGKQVCHTCDNPRCVNPEHLYLGDAASNAKDRTERGRSRTSKGRLGRKHGEEHYKAKLTQEQVAQIRSLYVKGQRGNGIRKLAKLFGVTPQTIFQVVNGQTWK